MPATPASSKTTSSAFVCLQNFCNALEKPNTPLSQEEIKDIKYNHAQSLFESCCKANLIYTTTFQPKTPEAETTQARLTEARDFYFELLAEDSKIQNSILKKTQRLYPSFEANFQENQEAFIQRVEIFVSFAHTQRESRSLSIKKIAEQEVWSFNECKFYLKSWKFSQTFLEQFEILCRDPQAIDKRRPVTPRNTTELLKNPSNLEASGRVSATLFPKTPPQKSGRLRKDSAYVSSQVTEEELKVAISTLEIALAQKNKDFQSLDQEHKALQSQSKQKNNEYENLYEHFQEEIEKLADANAALKKKYELLNKRCVKQNQSVQEYEKEAANHEIVKRNLQYFKTSFRQSEQELSTCKKNQEDLLRERESILTTLFSRQPKRTHIDLSQSSNILENVQSLIDENQTQARQIHDLRTALEQGVTQNLHDSLQKQTHLVEERRYVLQKQKEVLEEELRAYTTSVDSYSSTPTTFVTEWTDQRTQLRRQIEKKHTELLAVQADLEQLTNNGVDSGYNSVEVSPNSVPFSSEYFSNMQFLGASSEILKQIKVSAEFLFANLYYIPFPIAQMTYETMEQLCKTCSAEHVSLSHLEKSCREILASVEKQLPNPSLIAKNKSFIASDWLRSANEKFSSQKTYRPYTFSTKGMETLRHRNTFSTLHIDHSRKEKTVLTAEFNGTASEYPTTCLQEHVKVTLPVIFAYIQKNPGCTVHITDDNALLAEEFYNILKAHQNMFPALNCTILSPDVSNIENIEAAQRKIYGPLIDFSSQKPEALGRSLEDELGDCEEDSQSMVSSFTTASNSSGS